MWTFIFAIACFGHVYLYKSWIHQSSNVFRNWLRGILLFLFLCVIAQILQVVLYMTRYIEDTENAAQYKSIWEGFPLLHSCKTVSNDMRDWADDAAWMTGYFSICVLSSIWLTIPPRQPNTGSELYPEFFSKFCISYIYIYIHIIILYLKI